MQLKVRQALDERHDGGNNAAGVAKLDDLASGLKSLAIEIRKTVSVLACPPQALDR